MAWARGQTAGAGKNASEIASDAAHHRAAREIFRREPRRADRVQCRRAREHCVSSRHLLTWACVAVELTDQGAAVLLGRFGKLLDEALDLFARGVFQSVGTAEVDGV